ncbi:AMP-dependent synthetase/ligase [Gemmatimonas phototrophica]|uniref:AMP-dependent synthetase/ligase n=1 Tax=Gemmatimonas phototrophica TaxID=1379270 RepID=UPI001314E312|nr:AMP-dependent synthetase/ligase [Gemmatimonas phototrophica]
MDSPLIHRFFVRAEAMPDALMFAVYPRGHHTPAERITWGGMSARVRAIGARLVHAGVQVGDRIAVFAGNRPIWPTLDLAIQSIGAVGVGIYPSSTPGQVDHVLRDSGARWLFTDQRHEAVRLASATASVSTPLPGVVLDTHDTADVGLPLAVTPLHVFADEGVALLMQDRALGRALDARREAIVADTLAALIYTSGSTGEPKGACISHRYLAASAASIAAVLQLGDSDRTLSFLPYSHAAERVFGMCTRLLVGMSSALIEDPTDLFPVAAHFEPTLLGALPRIFERLYEAADVARREGRDPRAAITARVGHRVRLATSGGAALPVAIAETLQQLGLPILGAYGQTEHLCIAMNRPDSPRFDTVGPPMPGTTVRIDDRGELLVRRSALSFDGYWNRPAETRAAFSEDGHWLHTGDLAELLPDGSLRITGRAKELIALSTGRKVPPVPIEAALTASPFIAHAVCHGEGRKYLTALVAPRRDALEAWAAAQGIDLPWVELLRDDRVLELLGGAVADVNSSLARPDRVQRFAVVADEFSSDNGLLTPTFKVIRAAADLRYAAHFEALYGPATDVTAQEVRH